MPVFHEFLFMVINFSVLSSVSAADVGVTGDTWSIAVIPMVLFIIVLVALVNCAQCWPPSCYGGYENCPTRDTRRDSNLVNVRIVQDDTKPSGGVSINTPPAVTGPSR